MPTYSSPSNVFNQPGRPGTSDPAYLRRRALIDRMQADSTKFSPAYSWGEALAKALTPMVQAGEGVYEDTQAKNRDVAFQAELSKALAGAQGGQPVSKTLAASDNEDLKALAGQIGVQEQMARARAEARKPIMDPSGKFKLGHTDADGKTEWVPAHALPAELQGIQARAKAAAVHDYRMREAQAGAARVNVNTADNPFWKELGKEASTRLFEARDNASKARQSMEGANRMLELLDQGVITGTGANLRLSATRALATMGLVKGDDVAATEAYIGATAQQTAALAKMVGGTQISNADREFAQKAAAGDIEMTAEGLRRLLRINQIAARTVIDSYGRMADPILKNQNMPDHLKAILQSDLTTGGAAQAPQQQQAPATAQPPAATLPPSPPQPAPQFQGSAPADRPQIREGQTATHPQTGQRIIYRGGQWVPIQ